MRRLVLIFVCSYLSAMLRADSVSSIATTTNRVLRISPTSAKIPGGKLTLTIGVLHRTNDQYTGEFQMKVVPYFFKNEKGKVTIELNDETIAKAARGAPVEITGTAKTNGKNGPTRPIIAIATPANADHGALNLSILDGDRKLKFETDYTFLAN
jgi:hypothetical protein